MKDYGNITELVSLSFRQDTNAIQLRPNAGSTYTTTTVCQLPPDVSASVVLVGQGSTQTLINKSMSGSSNTFTNLPTSALTGTVGPANGGTGAANNAANTLTFSGNFSLGLTLTGNTSVTLPVTGTLATLAGAETLTNKTLTSPTLNTPVWGSYSDLTEVSTPAFPSAGTLRVYAKSDDRLYTLNSAGTESAAGASGSGELNLVSNSSTATNWTAATGATLATTTTAGDLPLSSMVPTAIKITSGTGTSTEATLAQTTSYSFTTPASYAVKTKVELWLRPGTNFIASEWTVSVYAGSTRQALTTDASSISYLPNASGKFTTYFDAAASTAYTVRFCRVNNAGVNAGVLNVANVIVGPGIQPQGAVVGPAIAYTPTWVGLGTTTNSQMFYQQTGAGVRIFGRVTTGTPTAVVASLTLPNSWTISITSTNALISGFWSINSSSASAVKAGAMNLVDGATTVNFVHTDYTTASSPFATLNGNAFAPTSNVVNVDVFIPSVGQLAGAGTANLAQNDVEYAYNTSTSVSASDSTSFGYGPGGALIQSITTALSRTVSFPSPFQVGDAVAVEVAGSQPGPWVPVVNSVSPTGTGNVIPYQSQNGVTYGIGILQPGAAGTSTVTLAFGTYAVANGATYGAAGQAWSVGVGAAYWRVRKMKGGQAVGFGIVNPGTSSGLVAAAGLPGNTTGTAIAAGYVGEVKTSTSSLVVYSASATWENVANLTMTAGLWLVSGAVGDTYNSSSSGADLEVAISGYSGNTTTDHTAYFNAWFGTSTPTNTSNAVLTAMPVFIRSDGTNLYIGSFTISGQTLYLKSRVTYTGTAHTRAGTITAARFA